MTGQFSEIDLRRCHHYARFFKDLTLAEANAIYWLLFILVLVLMCICSWQHHRSNALLDLEKRMPPEEVNTESHNRRMYEKRRGYFCVVVLCVLISTVAIILEAFAIFNIEYCDGEDLTQLYWSFWSILQVGSLIADLGVMVQFWIILSGAGTPPWAVALGTPVLVFAALGWMLKHQFDGVWNYARRCYMYGGEDEDSSDEEKAVGSASRWVSRAPTLVPESGLVSREEMMNSQPDLPEIVRASVLASAPGASNEEVTKEVKINDLTTMPP